MLKIKSASISDFKKIKAAAFPGGNIDNRLILIFLFILTIILHILPAARTVTFSDSGDFLLGIATTGNIHGPGSPLYMITARLFTLLFPVGPLAFRVSLYSGLFASLTACLMYLIIFRIYRSRTGGIVGALAFSFSYSYWYQTVIPETYSLNTFFMALLILLALKWESSIKDENRKKADNILCLFAFSFGLAISNHITTLFLLPAFVFFFIDTSWKDALAPRNLLRMAAFLALGLLPYIYEPAAAFRGPAYNYGDPSTPARWFEHVTFRHQRSGLFKYPYLYLPSRFWRYFGTLNTEFPYFAWLGGAGFIYSVFDKRRKYPLFFLFLFILALLPVMTYSQLEPVLRAHFYYPSYMIFSLWIGFAAAGAVKMAGSFKHTAWKAAGKASLVSVIFILALCPVVSCLIHYGKIDKSRYTYAEDMARDILDTAGPESIVFFEDDNIFFPCMYMQTVEGVNPEARLVIPEATTVPGFRGSDLLLRTRTGHKPDPAALDYINIVQRNLGFLNMFSAVSNFVEFNWNVSWSGYLVRILPPGVEPDLNNNTAAKYSNKGSFSENVDTDARESVLLPMLFKANVLLSKKMLPEATSVYEDTIEKFMKNIYVPTLYSCNTFSNAFELLGLSLNKEENYEETVRILPGARKIDPDFLSPSLAMAYTATGRYPQAIAELDKLIAFKPDTVSYYIDLAEVLNMAGNFPAALREIEKAVEMDPGNAKAYLVYGDTLTGLGRPREAQTKYVKVIELDKTGAYGPSARQKLEDNGSSTTDE
ncbi:MAG: DUF2723 domain-containing protein [Actinobacteria bacterium]|nr:DUF2723 domain-containing protein [Actinomycetota bacterium]